MSMTEKVLDAIPTGHEKAKPAKDISERLDMSDRQLRDYIQSLRTRGHPIVSNNNGYFLARPGNKTDQIELRRCIKKIEAHGSMEIEVAQMMRSYSEA